jgi:hypothetical protein
MSITFEKIQEVNKQLTTSNIKGKPYIEVNQRIKAFRMLYPNGSISTNIESLENGVVVMKAVVKDEEEHVLGTGYAYEKESSTFINKTSFIENCETSAVGRALGMLGIGIDTSVASYEEVQNAIKQQEDVKQAEQENIENSVIDDLKARALKARCVAEQVPEATLLKLYKVDAIEKLTMRQFANIHANWNKIKGN